MPSQAELFFKYHKDRKVRFKSETLKKLVDIYGGEEHLYVPEDTKPVQNEFIPEKEELVKIKKYSKKTMIKSIYPEDIYVNGHKGVWGSFYHNHFGWGYKCCNSLDKNSSCKGIEGKKENLRKIVSLYSNH